MPPIKDIVSYNWAAFGLVVFCYVQLLVWPDFMAAMGAGNAGVWFLDINTLLASNDAVVQGLNPYLPNPLDYMRDSHVYSDWWLLLHYVGLGRGDRLWMGALINLLFFLSLFWQLRVRSFREMLMVWLLIWSPPFILGFNRANPDLLIYALLMPAVPALLSRSKWKQAGAFALITLAIGLKYYPVVAVGLVFLTARTRGELIRHMLVWTVLGVALAINLHDDIARSSGLMTASAGFYTFGAAALAANLGLETFLLVVGLLLAAGFFIQGWRRPIFVVERSDARDCAAFALGAGIVVMCFFVTISYTYRLVFILMTLPFLFGLARSQARRERIYACALLIMSLVLVWADGMSALLINMNIDVVPPKHLRALLDWLIVLIHGLGWVWVLLWLLGLGGIFEFGWRRWKTAYKDFGLSRDGEQTS